MGNVVEQEGGEADGLLISPLLISCQDEKRVTSDLPVPTYTAMKVRLLTSSSGAPHFIK